MSLTPREHMIAAFVCKDGKTAEEVQQFIAEHQVTCAELERTMLKFFAEVAPQN